MTGTRRILFICGAVCTALAVLLCLFPVYCRKLASPVSVSLPKGIHLHLPAGWTAAKPETKNGITLNTFSKGEGIKINAAVCPARKIPFERQVRQDRNNLSLKKGYSIILEKNDEIHACPAYIFTVTSVRKGRRHRSKIVLFQKDDTLFYITLNTEIGRYKSAIPDFTKLIDSL